MTNYSTVSLDKLAQVVLARRNELNLSQLDIQNKTGINRLMIGRLEKGDYLPSLPQLNLLAEALNFSIDDLIEDAAEESAYTAMRGEAKNEQEAAGIDRLFSMMSFLKSQAVIRSKLTNGCK